MSPDPGLSRALLLAGLVLGGAVAAWHVVERADGGGLPAHAVARVGDELILRDEWLRAVAAVASERRTPLAEADHAAILDRLIDEALLVRHGLDLGLVARDPRLRGQLVAEVMQVTIDAQRETPDDDTLRRFHAEQRALFQPPAQLRVRAWRVDAAGARQPFVPAVPDALLPPGRLLDYVGPTLTQVAMRLPESSVSEPVQLNGTQVVIEVRERQERAPQEFEAIRDVVLAEWQRRADESAVRMLLDDLRIQYRVQAAP